MIASATRLVLCSVPVVLCGCTLAPSGPSRASARAAAAPEAVATASQANPPAPTAAVPTTTVLSNDIKGRFIAVICDADVTTTSMFDNQLRPAGAVRDELTILPLPIADSPDHTRPWQTRIGQAQVSNSVFGPPSSLAVTPDGRQAFVISAWGQRKGDMKLLSELPKETQLTVVDMQDPAHPRVLNTIELPGKPMSVDVNPAGDLVAVAIEAKGHEITLLDRAALRSEGEPHSWPLVGMEGGAADVGTIAWHPTGRYLAVTLPARGEVVFFEFTRKAGDGRPGIAPWGPPVKVGGWPLSGRFTPDGRSYVVACTDWDNGAGFTDAMRPGALKLIRLSSVPTDITRAGKPSVIPVEHTVGAVLPTGVSPESLVISPDGTTIAVGTWEGTVFPESDRRFTSKGGVATFAYTPGTGGLRPLATAATAGMPGGIAFDATGEHLIVSLFRGPDRRTGGVWRAARRRGDYSGPHRGAGQSGRGHGAAQHRGGEVSLQKPTRNSITIASRLICACRAWSG
jgi:DNA-binding beta-propeller fold protein YncE